MINLTIYLPDVIFFTSAPRGFIYSLFFIYFCNSKHFEVNIDRGLLGPQPNIKTLTIGLWTMAICR